MDYLGKEISEEGVKLGKLEVRVLVASPVQENVNQVHQLMGWRVIFESLLPVSLLQLVLPT